MTHLERVLREYIPEDKIFMASIEVMSAVLKDSQEPAQLLGMEGEENLIEIVFPKFLEDITMEIRNEI